MPLSEKDLSNLTDLERRRSSAVELENKKQIAYWRKIEKLGYVRISNSAICGFERISGIFLSITEAGRSLVKTAGTS